MLNRTFILSVVPYDERWFLYMQLTCARLRFYTEDFSVNK